MSRTSILAIGIAAIMMICALSGAVILANSDSNNNGIADVSKNSNVRVTSNITEKTYPVTEYQFSSSSEEETTLPMLPDNITDFDDVIADVADDIILSDFLDGRTFELNDTVYTIDSDTAALSYLYSLGYMSIGNFFVIDTYGINVTEEEEAEEEVDADEQVVLSANSNSQLKNELQKTTLRMRASQPVVMHTLCVEASASEPMMFLDFADLTVADFADANILINPETAVAEKTEIMADSNEEVLSNVMIESNEMFFLESRADFSDKAMFNEVEKKNTMFTECMTNALCNYLYMMIDSSEEAMETTILDAFTGSVFMIEGVPMVVEDAQTLAAYLFYNYDFQIVGTSIITIDYLRDLYLDEDVFALNFAKDDLTYRQVIDNNIDYSMIDMFSWSTYHFFDVAEISAYIFTDIVDDGEHYQMTTEKARLMGNGFASCVLSAYIQEGTTSNMDVYEYWGLISEDEEDLEVDDMDVNDIDKDKVHFTQVNEKVDVDVCKVVGLTQQCNVTTVLDVFMYTPFFYDGEFMTVEDIDTLGLYLSEQFLVITNDNMMSISTLNFEGVYMGIDTFPLENMPAMFFADFIENDFFNNHCFGTANVYDGGYFYKMPSDNDELVEMVATGSCDSLLEQIESK